MLSVILKTGNIGHIETVELPAVVEARQKVGLLQSRFAELLRVSLALLALISGNGSIFESSRKIH